jgi:hypothetical protein
MIKKAFVLIIALSISIFAGFTQNIQPPTVQYDTVYVPQDTIIKTVEMVQYEYIDTEPFHLFMGTGINYGISDLESDYFNKAPGGIGIPLNLKLTKGNFFMKSGIEYQNLKFNTSHIEQVANEVEKHAIETVVVDTIYHYNNGNPIASIITKEVDKIYYETVYSDTTITKGHNYSTFQIPMLVGYEIRFNKFSSDISAGVGFSFFTSDSRKDFKTDFPDEHPVFLSYLADLSLAYDVSDRITMECGISGGWKMKNSVWSYNTKKAGIKLLYKIF